MTGHTRTMGAAAAVDHRVRAADVAEPLELGQIYEECFDFVWRSARRMGVAESSVDDVVQEVFLVAHRRLADFEGRSAVRTWLFGILIRVVSDHRRTIRRKGGLAPLPEGLACESAPCPAGEAERSQALSLLHRLLDELDDEKRAVFVLAELEQLTAPEIAEALSINLNTVYSRLRAARREFEKALERQKMREKTA